MAFGKKQLNTDIHEEKFDLDNSDDRLQIIAFEKELEPYLGQSRNILGRVIKGFELYLHDNGLFRYSVRYPEGAVVFSRLREYRIADMKYHALGQLQDRRGWASEKDREALVGSEQMAMV